MTRYAFNYNEQTVLYKSQQSDIKGIIIYLHGGGLIFGRAADLPEYHINKLTATGYHIVGINYPLAPEASLDSIIAFVIDGIKECVNKFNLPYFLWGRSAGAYLCSLAIASKRIPQPKGFISYYGYGLVHPDWHNTPSSYYQKMATINEGDIKSIHSKTVLYSAPEHPRFLLYLYGRQQGTWFDMVSKQLASNEASPFNLTEDELLAFPPTFLAHNLNDNDVPYEESLIFSRTIPDATLFTAKTSGHNFDQTINNLYTLKLLKETIQFIRRCE